jgi:hypothetical protein
MTQPGDYLIPADETVFPANVIKLIQASIQQYDDGLFVTNRHLRPSDPNESCGVFPVQWQPDNESLEMRGALGASEPTIQRYSIGVEVFVKDADEIRGLIRHAMFAKIVRALLYRDDALRVSLQALSVTLLGTTERMGRYGIRTARYISNEISGSWLYVSTLEFWFETETV